MLYKIIDYLSTNLYAMLVVAVAIACIVFFIVGSIRMKKESKLMEEKRKEGEIDAPESKRRFIQGEVIEKQKIYTPEEKEEKDEKSDIS